MNFLHILICWYYIEAPRENASFRALVFLMLESCTMDEVGNNEDAVLLEYSVSGGMSVCSDALHTTFKRVACLEHVKVFDIYLGIREHNFPLLQQTAYVVGMKMCDVYQSQFFWSYSLFLQFRKKLAEWCTKSCVEQYCFSFRLKQQATHA